MLFNRIINFIVGYVRFRACSGFPERFINLCSLKGVRLWNLTAGKDGLEACTGIKDYFKIRSCAVHSGMRLKVTGRYGLPFFAAKYRYRIGVPIGMVLFLAIISFLSSAVWTIDIKGNTKTSDGEILEVLEQAGLKVGVLKSSVDAPMVRFYSLARLENITYITVNLMGSCVSVEVTEKVDKPLVADEESPCEIVSAVEGQITVLEVYEGTKMYKVGEAVRAGDVLAGGFVELADGSVRFRHAQAYALVLTQLKARSDLSAAQQISLVKTKKRLTLHFFGLNIPLFIEDYEKCERIKNYALTAAQKHLPVGYTAEFFNEYALKKDKDSEDKERLKLTESYLLDKIETVGTSRLIDEKVNITPTQIDGTFTVEMSAGVKREMLIE